MRVFDAFTFNNELDLLELRLTELDPVVDVFVLCELPLTFTRQPKAMHFYEHADRFGKWLHKIRLLHPIDYPSGRHPEIEFYQRRYLVLGMRDAQPEDVVMMGDVDEIPSRETVRGLREGLERSCAIGMRLYYYKVNLRSAAPWIGTVAVRRSSVTTWPIDWQAVRTDRGKLPLIQDGGWHFSWMGSPDQVREKLACIDVARDAELCGTPVTLPENKAIDGIVTAGRDLFGGDAVHDKVPIEPGVGHPAEIKAWLQRHAGYAA